MPELTRDLSKKNYSRLCSLIPGGVNSPVRAFHGLGIPPMVVASGKGDTIVDVDGNAFIDYCGSWGALILGHAHPEVISKSYEKMQLGTSFGITTKVEADLAEKIIQRVPSVEKIRFVSSGTEATMSAARLARGYTGRSIVIKFSGHYHGHNDSFLVKAGSGLFKNKLASSSLGIPEDVIQNTVCLPFNDKEALKTCFQEERIQKNLAAVIVEPIAGNMGVVPGDESFFSLLREETKKIGALLVFDEVITGFRVSYGGAQDIYSIKPDLTCFGKIMGGGFPAAAFGGKKEIMDCLAPQGSVYQAGTLSGNPVAMQAGLTTLTLLEEAGFYEKLKEKTDLLLLPIKEKLKGKLACLQQVGSMFTLFFGKTQITCAEDTKDLDLERFAHFFRHAFERGVYFPPSQHEASFVSIVHTRENLEKTSNMVCDYIDQYLV
ncbi:MAG: glutamate-1-semialdehyde 2,1-aminomutase [Chlamydiales bacterium]|nr:glutamate-1-semialdehyde 2,1-aminomutase [Chlamydiales bacterium]